MRSIRETLATGLALALFTLGCGGAASGPGASAVPGGEAEAPAQTPPETPDGAPPPVVVPPSGRAGFKVAHWNVQSGFGKAGVRGSGGFTPGSNCAANAWSDGEGPLARMLVEKVKHDGDVVALTLNEAWTCATPARIKALVGFAAMAPSGGNGEVGGVSIVARHGFAAAPEVTPLPKCSSGAEQRYVVRAPVYGDAERRTVVQVFATHWTGCAAEGTATRAVMQAYDGTPAALTGDLNVKSVADAPIAALRAGGYADAWATLHGASGGATATWNNAHGSPAGNLYKRIDYAFFKRLAVRSVTRFNTDGEPGTPKMADHAGLVIEYTH